MDSDLKANRSPDSLDCSSPLKLLPTKISDIEHQSTITSSSLSEKVRHLRYGIFLPKIKNHKSLSEESLTEKYNCDAVFIPREFAGHYGLAFLFYENLQIRDESFHFNHKKFSIEFELPDPKISRFIITGNYFNEFKTKDYKSHYNTPETNWREAIMLSDRFITQIVLDVIEAFEDFESTLYPRRISLWYFLLFKLYIFLNKRCWYHSLHERIKIVKFFSEEKIISDLHTQLELKAYFCFDRIYQILNYERFDCMSKLKALKYTQFRKMMPESLRNFVPESDLLEIMTTNRVKSLFVKYIDSSVYEQTIAKIFEETYVVEMAEDIQGTTLFNHRILISDFRIFKEIKIRKGLMILIFLHEMGHFAIRMNISTAKMALDLKNIPKPHNKKKKGKSPVGAETTLLESGGHVEEVLFGYRLETVTYRAAEWISNPKNWDLPDFQENFKQENANRMYGNIEEREIRIRSRCPRDLIHSGCGIGKARLIERYIC